MKQSPIRPAFTLIELLTVMLILGFLVLMVAPKLSGVQNMAKEQLNVSQMKIIKKGTLEFYADVGFVPDNVTLLTYPFETCYLFVEATSFDNPDLSNSCINMITFLDRHYKTTFSDPPMRLDNGLEGDNSNATQRTQLLIEIIKEKLNPDKNGWKGGYIGGNAHLDSTNVKKLGDGSLEEENLYFFSKRDKEIYNMDSGDTLFGIDATWDINKANKLLYPVFTPIFQNNGGTMDTLYENAKNRRKIGASLESTMLHALTVLDPYGTPYEIQIPFTPGNEVRTKYARIVSFGPNRRRDTSVNTISITYETPGYDDSVLYIFDCGEKSFFYSEAK